MYISCTMDLQAHWSNSIENKYKNNSYNKKYSKQKQKPDTYI